MRFWYLGDCCRDVLPTLGRVDAVVTDPPYSVSVAGSFNIFHLWRTRRFDFFHGDDDWIAMNEMKIKIRDPHDLTIALEHPHPLPGPIGYWTSPNRLSGRRPGRRKATARECCSGARSVLLPCHRAPG